MESQTILPSAPHELVQPQPMESEKTVWSRRAACSNWNSLLQSAQREKFTIYGYEHGLFCTNMLLEVEDPIGNSTCYLDTEFCYKKGMREGYIDLVVTRCSLIQEEHCGENLVVDDFCKGDMPNWMPEDALTGSYKLQYYEMKESDVEQEKEWLHLYAQLALLAFGFYPDDEKTEPFELRKIVVQTKEDVESKNKARAKNAIFYITFKCSGGQDYKAIVRRTTAHWPEHLSLEVKRACHVKTSIRP